MQILVHLLINALAVFITARILPGVRIADFWTAIVVAVVLGVVNTFLRPVLLILTLPITIVTFGIFAFVLNAFLVLLVSGLVTGFEVSGFWWALLFSLVLSLVSIFLYSLARYSPRKTEPSDLIGIPSSHNNASEYP